MSARPPGLRELWVLSAPFLGFPGPRSRGAESVPRTSLSLGSGFSGFSQPLASLGVILPLLPLEAHRRAQATLRLLPRSVVRAAPPPFAPGLITLRFSPFSQRQPLGCAAFSRVARTAAPVMQRETPRPLPRNDLVENQAPTPPPRGWQPPALPTLLPGLPDSENASW